MVATTAFDFFATGGLPVPTLTTAEAEAIARDRFGLAAVASELGSQQDQNFLLVAAAGADAPGRSDAPGRPVGVLKVAKAAFTVDDVRTQDAVAEAVAAADPDLRVSTAPQPAELVDTRLGLLAIRVIRFLDGGTFSGDGALGARVVAAMGDVVGRVSAALAGVDLPGLDRVLQWDLRHADRVVAELAPHLPGGDAADGLRCRVEAAAAAAWAEVSAVADGLRVQAGHFDLTDDNLVRGASGLPDGVIDFGDVTRSWAVGELATLIAGLLHHADVDPAATLPAIRAFHARHPLTAAEVRALWPLVVLRGAVLVASGAQQLVLDASNDYAAERAGGELRSFERAVEVPTAVMTALVADALGVDVPRFAPGGDDEAEAVPVADLAGAARLDLDVESDLVDDGAWLEAGLADRVAHDLLRRSAPAVATRYGAVRLDGSPAHPAEAPATIATGVDLWVAVPTVLRAPGSGAVHLVDGGLRLAGASADLVLRGVHAHVADGATVAAGADLAEAAAGERVGVQVVAPGADVPARVPAALAAGWLARAADPGPLLGLAWAGPRPAGATSAEDAAALLDRRDRSFAAVQEHYYDRPPRIERGWRHHLVDVDGRAYLDMVNNVTAVGHAHPRVTEAVARQLRRLNTNSRFHYRAVAEYAERLAALLPDPLDTVFLVNSGSEATDLAIRIATAATGHRDVVSLTEAYHGWTVGSDAVSTSIADNPNALGTRPDWVHPLDSPNAFRGRHTGADASRYAPEAVAAIDALVAAGRPPAAIIAETLFGNAGAVPLPDGYLADVYGAIRRGGGLAIADEVQVGFGRLGHWFWGFEQQGVVPDVVAVAKSIGNGMPLGAVITTREIADRFAAEGPFFSSTGGSPVSCAAGLAVLDVIEEEGLQRNAAVVGAHLRAGLEELATRHPLIGAVHGVGLYLGVELVRDRRTLEPATAEARAVCDRLLGLGVIEQPTGDHKNVLKVKPPLCLDEAAADAFVAALDRVLAEGFA
ncbi:aminotransferase [Agromyces sp. MMS24-K17]|uniref:aminotransferase n=1 Tax=Agromyces sp. MMS24-K17 TaxID=3372850 RepID=UPI00375497FA